MNKKLKRLLAAAVCMAMVMTSVQFPAGSVKAATGEAETTAVSEANEAGMSIVSRKNYSITDGATLQRVVMRNSLGNQAVGHMTTINLSSTLTLKASYTGYYTAGSTAAQRSAAASSLSWGLAQTTQQAAAYEKAKDTEGTVVWGTNADFFNMQTGQPLGYLIMEGNTIQTGSNEPYFAILKDGTAVIRDYGTDTSDVEEAISGPFYLVQNGQNVVDPNASDRLPTNSVGIKADGSVVFLQIDGRQDPYSTGSTLYEIASLMKDAGCVTAIYLDGGGSATVAARVDGSDSIELMNSPSDGKERTVSTALLLVSTQEATGEFDHAVISPDVEQYTTGSAVTFTAEGADPSGAPADLPASGLTWKLTTKDAGKIDASTGEFTAAKSYVGDATVTLNYNNKQVGSATITLGEIDKISFSSSSTSLDFATESDLGLTVESGLQEINYKDGDFKWTVTSLTDGYTADQIGTVTDNVFTSGPKTDTTLNGTVTVSYTKADGTELTASINVEIGKMPTVLLDFEEQQSNGIDMGANSIWGYFYAFQNQLEKGISGVNTDRDGALGFGSADGTSVDPNGITIPATISTDEFGLYGLGCSDFINGVGGCSCWHDAPYSWDCVYDPAALFHQMGYDWAVGGIASAADGAYNMYAKRVDSTTGEVRFGEHALEFHYDYSTITGTNNTNEYLIYTGDNIEIEGTPSALGMWVYCPEGTPNYWFTMYLAYWNGSQYKSYGLLHGKTTTVNAAGETVETTTQYTGINWSGWQYVEFDLSGFYNSGKAVDIENHPLMIMQGSRLLDLIIIPGGTPNVDGNKITCGSTTAGSIYIDNVRAVYGTTVDDLDNPVISKVSAGSKDAASYDLAEVAEDGSTVIDTNDVQIFAQYEDPQGENASGIAEENTTILIDGQEIDVTANKDQAVAYATLPNGTHTMTVTVMDQFGNKATKNYTFKVESDAEDTLPSVDLSVSAAGELGKSIVIKASTAHAEDIASVALTVKYGNVDTFDNALVSDPDAAFLTTANITYGSKYAGDDYDYVSKAKEIRTVKYSAQRLTTASKTVKMTAQKLDGVEGKDDIITFTMAVPNNLTANDSFPVTVYAVYTTTDGQTYTVASDVSDIPVVPAYTITADTAVAGAVSSALTVTDAAGKAAKNVSVFKADGTLIGKTDKSGTLTTDAFTSLDAGAETEIYAVYDGGYSFHQTVKTVAAGSMADGTPTEIELNATQDASTTQNITWMSNPNAAAKKAVVEYALTSDYEESGLFTASAEGTAKLHVFNTTTNSAYINSVSLTGLTPATSYSYRVGDGEHWSATRTFTTDNPASASTNFFIIGDTQMSGSTEADAEYITLLNKIAEGANAQNPSFGIQTGDFVDNGGNLTQWSEILNVFDSAFGTIPIIQVLGNHEYYGDTTGSAAEALWSVPNDNYYSVEYGNVYVAVINYSAGLEEACNWLIQDAAASGCKFKVLAVHQPAYYTNPKGSSQAFNKYIPSAAEAAGIDLVVSGHDHSYARTEKLTQNAVDEQNGVVYMICGDLGEKSRSDSYAAVDDPNFHFAKVSQDYTSVYVSVTTEADHMNVTVYDVTADSQTVLDQFTIGTPYCEEGDHDFVYDKTTDVLTCTICGYTESAAAESYEGFAKDAATGKLMYFASGKYITGSLEIGTTHYQFDVEGLALTGWGTSDVGNFISYVYAIDGVCQKGLQVIHGDYYYFDPQSCYLKEGTVTVAPENSNGLFTEPTVVNSQLKREVKNDENGHPQYYIEDELQLTGGLVKVGNDYYYVEEGIGLITGCKYHVSISNYNLTRIHQGDYYFDNSGKLYDPSTVFDDVSTNSWYYDAVMNVYNKGIMTGTSARIFSPVAVLSRAQFATILYRMSGETVAYEAQFPDVAAGTFYAEAVTWAKNTGVITGYEDGRFGPADSINREQLATMLYRYAGYKGLDTTARADLSTYPDADSVSVYAVDAMSWCVAKGIITGSQGNLSPRSGATRAEAATMVSRFLALQ